MVVDPQAIRAEWPVGKVLTAFPGQDGRVRSARIKIGDQELECPTTRLVVMQEADE